MENTDLITKAIAYIKSEAAKNDISIDDVADHAGFSTNYFNMIFRNHTGFSVMEYVRFSRLKKAALLLATTDRDILDIALTCGYEAHESFTRAFKKQYGRTPTEYREHAKTVELVYGDFHNETVGARLVHEFPAFRILDMDAVIDAMLETDALRWGYEASCMKVNGGVCVSDNENWRDGFLWFTEWDGVYEGQIITLTEPDAYGEIARFMKIFNDKKRFFLPFCSFDEDAVILRELAEHGITAKGIERNTSRYYMGDLIECTAPEGFTMKEFHASDMEEIDRCLLNLGCEKEMWTVHMKREIDKRDNHGNEENSVFAFGIFRDGEPVGISQGGLQRAHNFVINNCVTTWVMKEHRSEELYRYAFCFVTNAALEKGAIPVDDMQIEGLPEERRCGKFNSSELGFRICNTICMLH